ncbi:MAG: aldehyde dehydrogenase family protein [Vulcanimicrobiaceae bacterium]
MNLIADPATVVSRNPATGEILGAVAVSDADALEGAVVTATRAFEHSTWTHNARLRASALLGWADALEREREELETLLVRESGKIVLEARLEINGSIDALRYNAGMARYIGGRSGMLPDGSAAHLERTPLGVTGFITPWNWPVLLLLRDLAAALAAGVTAVVKPPEATPLVVQRTLEIGWASGVPSDVVRVVHGGPSVGAALVAHPTVRAIAFTGSTATGRLVLRDAAATFKTVLLELGGKGPNLVFADADVDTAVETAVRAAFVTTGQMCMACTRVIAERSIYRRVREAVVERVRALCVGDPFDERSDMGPLIDQAQRARVLAFVERSDRGGTLDTGGAPATVDGCDGAFMQPTVVSGVERTSPLVTDEVFGPLVTVEAFESDEDALAVANAGLYGLTAGVWTSDVRRAWRMARGIRAGTVWVNGYNRSHSEMPSGGMADSGLGRTRGIEGIEQFTLLKHINWQGIA